MNNDKNYRQFIYELDYDSSLGEPKFDKNRYMTLYSKSRHLQEDIEIYGRVDNLFLRYETSSNVGSSTSLAYFKDIYFANSTLDREENGEKIFRHFFIYEDLSYHSKFEIEAIKNHCISEQNKKDK
jgi:hypothetical protein